MILFLLGVLLTIFSLYLKKSKIIALLFFGLMWVLFGWNYDNADLGMYKEMYIVPIADLDFFKYEGGYNFLIYCCRFIGMNFEQFHIAIAAFVLFFLFRFFQSFSYFPALLAGCFFWIFFPLQFVIFRNFIAFSIMLLGLIPVLKNEKYCNEKYVFFVLLAATIHISSLFYLFFLLAFKNTELKIRTISYWVVGTLMVIFITHQYIFSGLAILNKTKAVFYQTSLLLFVSYSLVQILNLYVIKYFLSFDNAEEGMLGLDNSRMNSVILNVNILMLFLIPVYYELAVFVRILLNFSIVNIVFIINKSFLHKEEKLPKVLFLAYLLFWFFGFVFFVRENTIIPLFSSNSLFR